LRPKSNQSQLLAIGVAPSVFAAPPLHGVAGGIDELLSFVIVLAVLGYIFLTSRRGPKK